MSQQSTSYYCRSLVSKGFVRRRRQAKDGRFVELQLTARALRRIGNK